MMKLQVWMVWVGCGAIVFAAASAQRTVRNSVGMSLVDVPAGEFRMGSDVAAIPENVRAGRGVMSERPAHGDFDKAPAHGVRITHAFAMTMTEVTVAQFREFDPVYKGSAEFPGYAAGVSWKQAMDYCAWLSKRRQAVSAADGGGVGVCGARGRGKDLRQQR
jgi:formylglycine-generating enzyme required for sulfatase activity